MTRVHWWKFDSWSYVNSTMAQNLHLEQCSTFDLTRFCWLPRENQKGNLKKNKIKTFVHLFAWIYFLKYNQTQLTRQVWLISFGFSSTNKANCKPCSITMTACAFSFLHIYYVLYILWALLVAEVLRLFAVTFLYLSYNFIRRCCSAGVEKAALSLAATSLYLYSTNSAVYKITRTSLSWPFPGLN